MGGAAQLRRRPRLLALAGLLALAAACTSTRPAPVPIGHRERGVASWYGPGFHGRQTASGEPFDASALTAAHRSLAFGTVVRVTNRDNGRSVDLRINDRGPFARGRILDVSRAAAEALGMVGPGTARVELEVVLAPGTRLAGRDPEPRGWIVQAGAFREAGRAAALAGDIKRRMGDVKIESEAEWHRVVVGPFKKRSKAERRAEQLERAGYPALLRPVGDALTAARRLDAAVSRQGGLAGLLGLAAGRPAPGA